MFRYTKWTFLREIAGWVYTFLMLSPLLIMVSTALKNDDEFRSTSNLELVKKPSADSLIYILGSEMGGKVFGGLAVSLGITAIAVLGLIFFGSLTAYVLVRRTSRMSKAAFYSVLGAIIMPQQLGMLPVYIGAKNTGLLGTPLGMGVIYIATLLPLAIVLYSGFIRSLPLEYEEAAYVDGATRFRAFFQIIFPQLAPATGTVAILCGIICWNDFFGPLVYMVGSEFKTIGLVIYQWATSELTYWNKVFALLIVAMFPMLTIYLIFQKKFIQGFSGGMKG